MAVRRIPGHCYLCGEPTGHEWFCASHMWANVRESQPGYLTQPASGHLGRHHAYWIERFTPAEVIELARYIVSPA